MMSKTCFIATLYCLVLWISPGFSRNQTVEPDYVKAIDAVVRGELATLILHDYNTVTEGFGKQNSECEKKLEYLEEACKACAKHPFDKLMEKLKKFVDKIATKAIEGVKRIGQKAGKFAKKVGGKVVDQAKNAIENVGKVFKNVGKAVGKALDGARNVIKGIGKAFRRIARRVRLPKIRRVPVPRIKVPRIRVRRFRFRRFRRSPRFRRFRRFRRRFGKKKRSELSKKQVDDIIDNESVKEKRGSCQMCEMDEDSLLKQICGDLSAEEKRVEAYINALQKTGDYTENSAVLTSVSYDDSSGNGQSTPIYTSVYVEVSIGYYSSTFKTAASFGYDSDTVIEAMGAIVAGEAYSKYKKSCEWNL